MHMRKQQLLILLSICLFICSCNRTNSIVKDTIGKNISHTVSDTIESKYYILRYVNNPSCTSCQLQAGGWKAFNRRIKKKYQNDVKIIFIVETEKPKEAERIIHMYKPCDNYAVDSLFKFISINKLRTELGKDFVVLLDSTRTVIAVGNPMNNPKVENLFFRLINKKATFNHSPIQL